ncbi:2-oxoisovalerate dehydrogenase subunit alpha 2, mitochondrial-like protein [Drosera capensis]
MTQGNLIQIIQKTNPVSIKQLNLITQVPCFKPLWFSGPSLDLISLKFTRSPLLPFKVISAMVISISRTRSIHNLVSKLGLLGRFGTNSTSTQHGFSCWRGQVGGNPDGILFDLRTLFVGLRFASSRAEIRGDDDEQVVDFPGGKVAMSSHMRFISASDDQRVPCYRVLDDDVSKETAVKMYSDMVTLQVMDSIFYEAQRQGRISFYLTSTGEEAVNIASVAALSMDDIIFPQYREPGVLLWRGFTIQEFANQCFSNAADYGKGRQMPIHYGSRKLNFVTVSSTVGTQLPQAVGAAYSLKMDKKDACVVTYFGDGGSSTGDFHAALNFAAVMEAPVIFFCRNNGWAISTPINDQFRGDGIVVRGRGYGIKSIRVDGNDALAIYNVVRTARQMTISEQRPILIEALTYRAGHHSTSDDSTKYRPVEEMEWWRKVHDPVMRFRKWVERNGWWNDDEESQLRYHVRKQVLAAIQAAEKLEKPALAELFTDVYEVAPSNLYEQERFLRETVERHPEKYPTVFPL